MCVIPSVLVQATVRTGARERMHQYMPRAVHNGRSKAARGGPPGTPPLQLWLIPTRASGQPPQTTHIANSAQQYAAVDLVCDKAACTMVPSCTLLGRPDMN
jgi:hypothetical protein